MTREEALELVCDVAEDWAGEYGWVMPTEAAQVFEAVETVRKEFLYEQ